MSVDQLRNRQGRESTPVVNYKLWPGVRRSASQQAGPRTSAGRVDHGERVSVDQLRNRQGRMKPLPQRFSPRCVRRSASQQAGPPRSVALDAARQITSKCPSISFATGRAATRQCCWSQDTKSVRRSASQQAGPRFQPDRRRNPPDVSVDQLRNRQGRSGNGSTNA